MPGLAPGAGIKKKLKLLAWEDARGPGRQFLSEHVLIVFYDLGSICFEAK